MEFFGIKINWALAGLFGALSALIRDKNISLGEALLRLVVGAASAGYLTPLVALEMRVMDIDAPEILGGVAFLVGMTAHQLVGIVYNRLQKFSGEKGKENE